VGIETALIAMGVSAALASTVATVVTVVGIVMMAASIAYSVYTMATMPDASSFGAQAQNQKRLIRSNIAPRRVVYGECEISGPIIYRCYSGENTKYLWLVIVLVGHQIEAIDEVLLDGKRHDDEQFTTPYRQEETGHWEYTYQVQQTDSQGQLVYQRVRNEEFGDWTDIPVMHEVTATEPPAGGDYAIDENVSQRWVVDIPEADRADGRPLVLIKKHLGHPDQEADPDLIEASRNQTGDLGIGEWTANHRLRGVAYAIVRLERVQGVYSQWPPNISFRVRGNNQIYDPRTGTIGYTNNWALCVRDYLAKPYGLNCDDDELNDEQIGPMANICDEDIPVRTGTGTGYTTDATGYEEGRKVIKIISGSGTILSGDVVTITVPAGTWGGTDYSASVKDYRVETGLAAGVIVLASDGLTAAIPPVTCTVTVAPARSEKRFTCNGTFTLDRKPLDIMKGLLSAAVGTVTWSRGVYEIHPAIYTMPEDRPLTQSDLRGSVSIMSAPSAKDRFNTVKGTFVDPVRNWQPSDFPPIKNDAAIARDGQELVQDIELPYTNSSAGAQRLAKIHLLRELQGITVKWPGKMTCFGYKPGQVVPVTLPAMGWVEKEFRITDWTLAEGGGVDLMLREESAYSYDWDADEQIAYDPAPNTNLANLLLVPPVTDIAFRVIPRTNPVSQIDLQISWVSGTVFHESFELQYRRVNTQEWSQLFSVNDTIITLTNISPGGLGEYDVRVRAVSQRGGRSVWRTERVAVDPIPAYINNLPDLSYSAFYRLTAEGHVDHVKIRVTADHSVPWLNVPSGLAIHYVVFEFQPMLNVADLGEELRIDSGEVITSGQLIVLAGSTADTVVVTDGNNPLPTDFNFAGMWWGSFPGSGGARKAVGNTATSILFSPAFDVAPAVGTTLDCIEMAFADERQYEFRLLCLLSESGAYEVIRWSNMEYRDGSYYINGLQRGQEGTSRITGGTTAWYYPAPGAGTNTVLVPITNFVQVAPNVWEGAIDVDVTIPAGSFTAATACAYVQTGTIQARSNIVPITDWRPM
jgi:hypothetical protein